MSYLAGATDELRHHASPITRFIHSEFPLLDDLAGDFARRVADAETLEPQDPGPNHPWSLVGLAIDYRLRFLFERVWYTRLSAFRVMQVWDVGASGTALDERTSFTYGSRRNITVSMPVVAARYFEELGAFLRRVQPARRYLGTEDEAWMSRHACVLALLDTKMLPRLRARSHPLLALAPGATVHDLYGLIPREAVRDVCRLSRRFLHSVGRDWLTRKVEWEPHHGIGNLAASADVLVDTELLDLKTTRRPRLDRARLDQVLLYGIAVSGGGEGRVRQAGFHLVRQGRTVSWPLDELMTRAGCTKPDLRRLWSALFEASVKAGSMPPETRWSKDK